MIFETILLSWAVGLLLFTLVLLRGGAHWHTPKPEPHPTLKQINGVVEVYEILGMYEGPKN